MLGWFKYVVTFLFDWCLHGNFLNLSLFNNESCKMEFQKAPEIKFQKAFFLKA